MSEICAVCGKQVEKSDQEEHLKENHLGPHYFQFDGVKHRTMRPSMTVSEIKSLVGASATYHVYEERTPGGERVFVADGVSVDLTKGTWLFAVPPATY